MTPLIMRELAIAWGKDDREHMGHLLTRFAPLLFGIAAWFSCFTAVEASVLVHIFGGVEFAAALVPVQIMALYPAHQAYGQLASSVFHATGKTKVLRNLAFTSNFGGFLLVWLLVAPQDMLGMGLGANGPCPQNRDHAVYHGQPAVLDGLTAHPSQFLPQPDAARAHPRLAPWNRMGLQAGDGNLFCG